ncbi:MAG: penicillin acylase family protein [Pyrinomonadaceae bacterium]
MPSDTPNVEARADRGSLELPTLRGEVTIRRDGRGVPYIEASNDDDLYFAQGYATACDRLWQMDILRRTARGELAEIFGPAALEQDKTHRVYGFSGLAETMLERATARTRAALEAYARGVNAFIRACAADSLPAEFKILRYAPREWAAVDSLALGKLFAESLSVTADADILRALMGFLPPEKIDEMLPAASPLDVLIVGGDAGEGNAPTGTGRDCVAARAKMGEAEVAALTALLTAMRRSRAASGGDGEVGSNSWVVGGGLTASGKPLLSNDPHLAATSPSIWHITHLSAPGVEVSGVAVTGIPGVMIGHNARIAWGLTNLCPDVQDIYLERFDENDPSSYMTPAGWRRAEVRREVIKVRASADGSSSESVAIDVKVTRHGPVIFESGTLGVALRWTAFDTETSELETFFELNRARDWDDFVAALSLYGAPPQNFVYADTDGHIGYYSAGRIPIRRSGDGSLPYDGATDDGEWVGFIPFEELPHVFDPPSGVIVTANNRLVGRDYPHHITHNWRVPYRARRIHELLTAGRNLTAEDFLSVQGDTYSYPDVILASEVVKLAEHTDSPQWREMAEAFRGWDGRSNPESKVLPLVTETRKAFRRRVLEGALGAELARLYDWRNEGTFLDKLITQRPAAWLPEGSESYESLLLACYGEARESLAKRLGPDPERWTWGALASVRFPHPLEKLGQVGARFSAPTSPQNTGGSMPTVNAGDRVSMRFVADLSDWSNTRLCIPLGESGDPSSPHRADQFDEWLNVAPRALPFDRDSIASAAREVLTLRPSPRQ